MRYFTVIKRSKTRHVVRWIDTPELNDQELVNDEHFVEPDVKLDLDGFYSCEVKAQNQFKLSSIKPCDENHDYVKGYEQVVQILKQRYKKRDPIAECFKEAAKFGQDNWDKGEFYRDTKRVCKWLLQKHIMDYQYEQEKAERRAGRGRKNG